MRLRRTLRPRRSRLPGIRPQASSASRIYFAPRIFISRRRAQPKASLPDLYKANRHFEEVAGPSTTILEPLGPFSGPMEHPENFNPPATHPVGDKVRRAPNYQLSRAGNPSRPAGARMRAKSLNACHDTVHCSCRRSRIVTRDVCGLLVEVNERAPEPPYLHRASTS